MSDLDAMLGGGAGGADDGGQGASSFLGGLQSGQQSKPAAAGGGGDLSDLGNLFDDYGVDDDDVHSLSAAAPAVAKPDPIHVPARRCARRGGGSGITLDSGDGSALAAGAGGAGVNSARRDGRPGDGAGDTIMDEAGREGTPGPARDAVPTPMDCTGPAGEPEPEPEPESAEAQAAEQPPSGNDALAGAQVARVGQEAQEEGPQQQQQQQQGGAASAVVEPTDVVTEEHGAGSEQALGAGEAQAHSPPATVDSLEERPSGSAANSSDQATAPPPPAANAVVAPRVASRPHVPAPTRTLASAARAASPAAPATVPPRHHQQAALVSGPFGAAAAQQARQPGSTRPLLAAMPAPGQRPGGSRGVPATLHAPDGVFAKPPPVQAASPLPQQQRKRQHSGGKAMQAAPAESGDSTPTKQQHAQQYQAAPAPPSRDATHGQPAPALEAPRSLPARPVPTPAPAQATPPAAAPPTAAAGGAAVVTAADGGREAWVARLDGFLGGGNARHAAVLESAAVEAQRLQDRVLELRLRMAVVANRQARMDCPFAYERLGQLRARAEGAAAASIGFSPAVAAGRGGGGD